MISWRARKSSYVTVGGDRGADGLLYRAKASSYVSGGGEWEADRLP